MHFIVEVDQAFADAVTHDLPAEVVRRRFKAVGEVGDADLQGVLGTAFGAAAACRDEDAGQGQGGRQGQPFFRSVLHHVESPFSVGI